MKPALIEIPAILTSAKYLDYLKYSGNYIYEPEDEFKNAEGYVFPWGVIREEFIDSFESQYIDMWMGAVSWYFYPTEVYQAAVANWKNAHPYEVMDIAEYMMLPILDTLPNQSIELGENDAMDLICLTCNIVDYEVALATLEKYIVPELPNLWHVVADWAQTAIETPTMAFHRRRERKGSAFH